MEPSSLSGSIHVADDGRVIKDKSKEQQLVSKIDPLVFEALENPRHRLTVLRMELDVQSFMRNSSQHQFEFQHYPTSYLRCAAHRVAQHYGLQTMVLDITSDGSGKIVAWKTPESRFPDVCLSEVPAKHLENCNSENFKLVLRQRPNIASQNDVDRPGIKNNPVRSVEERKEDYDKARARIFNNGSIILDELEDEPSQIVDDRTLCSNINTGEIELHKVSIEDPEKTNARDGASRIAAVFRNREKDRTDPDYDRSYDRYAKGANPRFDQCNVLQIPFIQYGMGFPQIGVFPRPHPPLPYGLPNQMMNPYGPPTGCNQPSRDAVFMQWSPNPALMYGQSYGQYRHAPFQVPFNQQQPLSFETCQKH
ncbi:Single-stranded nucleic acid binding R3H protein [Zostera marina]|uniref:Single-stranded nucleic acid binding R3H protein n=1 Tax=Zostera marina TaxID=29655 RepID=A0A0K9P368_ZOSMR|nr:Single-stranded nucleic acid binding R3H protein [Zostera marina]